MDVESIMCTSCGGGEDEDQILLCDGKGEPFSSSFSSLSSTPNCSFPLWSGCENAYHMYCLSIPLTCIPEGDWFCDECTNQMKEEEEKKNKTADEEQDNPDSDEDYR